MGLIVKSNYLQTAAQTISLPNANHDMIGKAIVFSILSNSAEGDHNLSTLRFKKYMSMMATSKSKDHIRLPPATRAAHFHTLRVQLKKSNAKL